LRHGDRDVQLRSQVTIYNCRIGGIVLVPGCNYPPLSAADLHRVASYASKVKQ
jgi:hypothetical protein